MAGAEAGIDRSATLLARSHAAACDSTAVIGESAGYAANGLTETNRQCTTIT